MNQHFPEIKKNFGFGMMRLPMIGEEVDMEQTKKMVDAFLAAGFNYFDTAHPYIQGKSEDAVKTCIAERHPRESFLLANKLSGGFEKEEEIRPLIDLMLEKCGVEYFDFFLMHAMSATRFEKYRDAHAYEVALECKAEGKLRHVGLSFHDTADVLDRILTAWPEIEFVQLQFNYLDYEDPRVQSRLCYEVCEKHGKPVMVMEPVRGGALVNLPAEALELLPNGSPASYALRYAAGFPLIAMVLSGMSDEAQMADNLATMGDFKPLTDAEQEAVVKVRTIYQSQHKVPCTACGYCVDGCPAGIPIPDIFALLNKKLAKEEMDEGAYGALENNGESCVGCGACEHACPQKLEIRQLLKEAHKVLG
jgi:predicted aldo/keto reductase-like oxidoreductase